MASSDVAIIDGSPIRLRTCLSPIRQFRHAQDSAHVSRCARDSAHVSRCARDSAHVSRCARRLEIEWLCIFPRNTRVSRGQDFGVFAGRKGLGFRFYGFHLESLHLEPLGVHFKCLLRLSSCVRTLSEERPSRAAHPRHTLRLLLRFFNANNFAKVPGSGIGCQVMIFRCRFRG
jgi:hypothetical protein